MNKKALAALKKSIKKWYRIAYKGERLYEEPCALCDYAFTICNAVITKGVDRTKLEVCSHCPVYKQTGQSQCECTPYWRAFNEYYKGARTFEYRIKEFEFLTTLLPEGETVKIDGYEYGWKWK